MITARPGFRDTVAPPDVRQRLRKLRDLIGPYAVRRLREGKVFLFVWRCSTPHNYWVSRNRSAGRHLWHSSDRDYPDMGMFELVGESERRIGHHWIHGDGGRPESSTYRLRKEFMSDALSASRIAPQKDGVQKVPSRNGRSGAGRPVGRVLPQAGVQGRKPKSVQERRKGLPDIERGARAIRKETGAAGGPKVRRPRP